MARRAIALLVLVLAGTVLPSAARAAPLPAPYCAGAVEHGPAGKALPAKTGTRACRYDVGVDGAGPVPAVTSKGVLFLVIGGGNLIRSTDQGRTWTKVPVPPLKNGDAGGSHAYLHVDPRTDRVWHIASTSVKSCSMGGAPALSGAVVNWSDDLGKTWTGTTVTCDTYDWGRLVTGPAPKGNKYPSAVYFLGVGKRLVGGERPVYRSLDAGKTWQLMKHLASATTEAGGGVTATDGTIYFEYPEFIGFDPTRVINQDVPFKPENLCKQMVAVSEDYGVTWRQHAIPSSLACRAGTGNQKVAVDQKGTVYAIWTDDVDSRLHMVTSTDKGRTWSTPVDVQPPGTTYSNNYANIAASVPGKVFIAGMFTTSPVNPKPANMNGVGDWSYWVTRSSNPTAASPTFESVLLEPAGDSTITTGEGPPEQDGYLTINASGAAWVGFIRHAPYGSGFGAGRAWVARFEPAAVVRPVVVPLRTTPPATRPGSTSVDAGSPGLPSTGIDPAAPGLALLVLMSALLGRRRCAR